MTTFLYLYVGAGIVLILLSIPLLLEKIGPNPFYGFRVAATLEAPKIWYAVNKFAAKRLIAAGAAIVLAAAILYAVPGITVDTYALACLGVFMIAFVPGIVQCVRYLKSLRPD